MKAYNQKRGRATVYSTFALLFYINCQKVKKNGMCPVMGRISVNAEVAQFSTGLEVDPALWNTKTYRVKGNSHHAAETNHRIERLTDEIDRYHSEILAEQGYITAELVKNAVTGIGRRKTDLLELFREHNDEYAARTGDNRSGSRLRTCMAVCRQLECFLETHYGVRDIPLRALEPSFIERFDSFLRIEQGLAACTVAGYTIILRKVVCRAIAQGTLRTNPFAAYVPQPSLRRYRHMTMEELERFMGIQLEDKRLCHTRDVFVFSTFTGISYADMCNLSEDNIKKGNGGGLRIVIERQKTGTRCDIPLLDIPQRIIEKYAPERKGNRLFKMLSIARVEVHLNRVTALCGIDRRVTYHQRRHSNLSYRLKTSELQVRFLRQVTI